jgi:photosystem II stability/assembly factor-like uncharacterized protein
LSGFFIGKNNMKNLLYVCLTLLLTSISFSQEYSDWKYVHPTPQANNLRATQMIDINSWVATGANGTFMISTNSGADWFFHNQAGRYSNSAQAIGQNYALKFFDVNNGFVTGEFGYIGKTTNGGVSFDSVGIGSIPTTQRGQSIWFANSDTGFIAAGSGNGTAGTLVRTTDGGNTWTSVYSAGSSFLSVCGTSSTNIFAVTANGTVFHSTNAGQNWQLSSGVVPQFMYSLSFLDQNIGFIVGGNGEIRRTTDAGVSWDSLGSPQANWSFFQIKIISASEIYCVGDPNYLYRSTDLGNTWSPILIFPVNGPASTYIWYSMDKIGSTIILSGDYGVVAKSEDNGLTWSAHHFSLTTQLIFDMIKVPDTNKLFAVGRQFTQGTKQLFISTDNGLQWVAQDLGVNFDASVISMPTSQVGYIAGTNSIVLKTTNGGTSWFQVTQPYASTLNIFSMEFINPDTGWVFFNYSTIAGGNIFKTTDGGISWTQQTNGLSNSINSADMVDANIGYHTINSSNRPIYKTTNGGTTWNAITTPLTGLIRTINVIDENTVYIGQSSGSSRMAKTTNGGSSWTLITLPIPIDITSMDFFDADTGYVCGNLTTVVCRTTDGGNSWTFENLHLPTLVKVVVMPGDIAFAFGTYGSIRMYDPHSIVPVELSLFSASVNNNNIFLSWSIETELNNRGFEVERKVSTSNDWTSLGFIEGRGTSSEPKTYVYQDFNVNSGISYNYRIRQTDYDGSVTVYNLAETVTFGTPINFELAQNYPNPFNPSTTITFSIPQKSDVSVKIYDILGNEVTTLVNETREAGRYNVNFNASKYSSGVYFYSIKAGNFIETKKMNLLK